MKNAIHHQPPRHDRRKKPRIGDAIAVFLSDEHARTSEEIHAVVERNGYSRALRSTTKALDEMRFNLVAEGAPYRLRKLAIRPTQWKLIPVTS